MVRLPSGRPQLRVLPVSGAVRQRWPLDPSGRAANDAERTRGSRGAAAGEEATRAGERSARESASREIGEGGLHKRARKRPGTTERPEHTAATGYRSEREEGGRRRDRGHRGWGGRER